MALPFTLRYNPIPVNYQRPKKKEVYSKHLKCYESFNPHRLPHLLLLHRKEYYPTVLTSHKVFEKIKSFILKHQLVGRGFLSIVEYDASDPENVYGNHYIIASSLREAPKYLENLRKLQPDFKLSSYLSHLQRDCDKDYCLTNYETEEEMIVEHLLYDICDTDFLFKKPILLGKKVIQSIENIDNAVFENQLTNLHIIDMANLLIAGLRHRLGSLISQQDYDTNTDDCYALISKLKLNFGKILTETVPLEIKATMQSIYYNLHFFGDNFCNLLRKGNVDSKIIKEIHFVLTKTSETIERQSYGMWHNVFCAAYLWEQEYNFKTPVIQTPTHKFKQLLSIFEPNGFTFLKFRKAPIQIIDDWHVQVSADQAAKKVSFTCFDVSSEVQNYDSFDSYFVSPCFYEPSKYYHWICLKCQKLVKVNKLAKIKCDCGVGNAPTVDPECLNCAMERGTFQSPFATNDDTNDVAASEVIAEGQKHENVTTQTEQTQSIAENIRVDKAEPPETCQPLLSCPPVPQLTVLVIGRSKAHNYTLIDSIARSQETDESKHRPTQKECIVNYGEYEIKYVSIILNNTPINWSFYPEIHGFIFVIESKGSTMSSIVEGNLRNLLGMIPRNFAKNCCIVNCYAPTTKLTLAAASKQLSAFVEIFCKFHELDDHISHFCVDKSVAIRKDNMATEDYKAFLASIEANVEQFIDTVAESPVTTNDLKMVAALSRLAVSLNQKTEDPLETKEYQEIRRLKASISDNAMFNEALLYRCQFKNVRSLTDDDWKAALNWDMEDDLLQLIREINEYMEITKSSKLHQSKSKSIFALLQDTTLQQPQIKEPQNRRVSNSSKTPNYNVLILGSSESNKQFLLTTLRCVQQYATFDDAVQNAETVGFQDSDDYVIDYGDYSIRYINKYALNIEVFDIHGVLIVVESATDDQIRETFNRLPRRAIMNCCVVNTFTPIKKFALKDAEEQMLNSMKTFCDQHGLTYLPSFICLIL